MHLQLGITIDTVVVLKNRNSDDVPVTYETSLSHSASGDPHRFESMPAFPLGKGIPHHPASYRCSRLSLHVESGAVNAADATSGRVADIECFDGNNREVLAAGAKDQILVPDHVESKVENARVSGVTEVLFLANKGLADEEEIQEIVKREFAAGHNVYVQDEVTAFLKTCFILLGEEGRRTFLLEVGNAMEKNGVDYKHRKARLTF